jgi:hypothetical protein
MNEGLEGLEQDILNSAANVFVDDAQVHDSPNFRTHTVLVGDETWEITVRRAEGKTPDQHITDLESQLQDVLAQRDELRSLVEQVEWVRVGNEPWAKICVGCRKLEKDGHAPDCSRQAALRKAEEAE